jgi:hypothetical protein
MPLGSRITDQLLEKVRRENRRKSTILPNLLNVVVAELLLEITQKGQRIVVRHFQGRRVDFGFLWKEAAACNDGAKGEMPQR